MTIIPPSARVIEWGTDGSDYVAHRFAKLNKWLLTGQERAYDEGWMIRNYGLTAENLVVLATFREPTIEDVLGAVDAFWCNFPNENPERSVIYLSEGRWWKGPLGYTRLEELNIDLSTVTPLVPRGES